MSKNLKKQIKAIGLKGFDWGVYKILLEVDILDEERAYQNSSSLKVLKVFRRFSFTPNSL
ncbi:hypothetical protein BFG04_03755 [Campylobacter pinnipediorum subsp. pinnipediorum]|uniref:Uncharacterized protein n=1 Tax=Campylobacter pinnipediorum subsp. pinnipediorum TaxID=1660067 RepID=A0AAX0L9G5_9BACT|nr:hypothetical protein [Campylobacter pinnipediorum]OPA77220.1 hypothetical protein BFG04_03755 [Campylobacter pinnipediorum subsp. pinnipediorum]